MDNVAYSLTEAEHLVFLYYESVASRRLATIPAFQQLVQADDTSNQTVSHTPITYYLTMFILYWFQLSKSNLAQNIDLQTYTHQLTPQHVLILVIKCEIKW